MPPKEILDLITSTFGGYVTVFVLAGWALWKWGTSASAQKQKRLDEQEKNLDAEWAKIRTDLENRVAQLNEEIKQIREGHSARLGELNSLLLAKRTELDLLRKELEVMRKDLENGWDRGRGAMHLLRTRYHETNNERQRVDALLRHHNLPPIVWTANPEPPDLADVPPIKG